MPKAYLVTQYRAIKDPQKLAAYAALAKPAIESMGGVFVVRGMPAAVHEAGLRERTVVVEFPDLATALKVYDSPAYQEAIRALDGGAERDMRVVEGV